MLVGNIESMKIEEGSRECFYLTNGDLSCACGGLVLDSTQADLTFR